MRAKHTYKLVLDKLLLKIKPIKLETFKGRQKRGKLRHQTLISFHKIFVLEIDFHIPGVGKKLNIPPC